MHLLISMMPIQMVNSMYFSLILTPIEAPIIQSRMTSLKVHETAKILPSAQFSSTSDYRGVFVYLW